MVQKVAVNQQKLEIVREIEAAPVPVELAAHPLFAGARQRTLTVLSNRFDVIRVPRGASIYQAGNEARAIYIAVTGIVRTQHRNALGETLESAWKHAPAALGLGELLGDCEEMQESAQAVDSTTVYVIPYAVMRDIMAHDPQILMNAVTELAKRHVAGLKIERSALETAFARVANYLTLLSSREGKEVAPDLYMIRTTQEDVAAAAGLNPRTVSRAMKVLQKKGRLYVRRGEYLVRTPTTLAAALANEE